MKTQEPEHMAQAVIDCDQKTVAEAVQKALSATILGYTAWPASKMASAMDSWCRDLTRGRSRRGAK